MKKLPLYLCMIFLWMMACKGSTEYPAAVKENFVNSCSSRDDAKKELCACIFEKIKEKYTYTEYVAIEEKMKAGQTPQEFLSYTDQATEACAQK